MQKLFNINRCDVYVAIWCLYRLQGLLYPQGAINQILQLVMLLWAMVVAVPYILNIKNNPRVLNALNVLVLMYTVYGVCYLLFGTPYVIVESGNAITKYIYLQNSLNSLLPIYLFYHYTRIGYLSEQRIKPYLITFFLMSIILFFTGYQDESGQLMADEVGLLTNNMGYMWLSLLPFLFFLYERPFVQFLMLVVIMFFILLGMKRGAILLGTLATIYFLFRTYRNTNSVRTKTIIIVFSALVVLGTISYIGYLYTNNDYFVQRIENTQEGNVSNRDVLYTQLIEHFMNEQSVLRVLFGNGANYTLVVAMNYAHQDWLETLINNGVMGVLILLVFYLSLFKCMRKLFKPLRLETSHLAAAFCMLWCLMLGKTMFSMSIQDMSPLTTLPLGYLIYQAENNHV